MTLHSSVNLLLRSEIIRWIRNKFVEELPLGDLFFLNQDMVAQLHDFPNCKRKKNHQANHPV